MEVTRAMVVFAVLDSRYSCGPPLTKRQAEAVTLMLNAGLSVQAAGRAMGLTLNGAKALRWQILQSLGADRMPQAIAHGFTLGAIRQEN